MRIRVRQAPAYRRHSRLGGSVAHGAHEYGRAAVRAPWLTPDTITVPTEAASPTTSQRTTIRSYSPTETAPAASHRTRAQKE